MLDGRSDVHTLVSHSALTAVAMCFQTEAIAVNPGSRNYAALNLCRQSNSDLPASALASSVPQQRALQLKLQLGGSEPSTRAPADAVAAAGCYSSDCRNCETNNHKPCSFAFQHCRCCDNPGDFDSGPSTAVAVLYGRWNIAT